MMPRIRDYLSSLPPLTPELGRVLPIACKMCGGSTNFFAAVDFQKHCGGEQHHFGKSGLQVEYRRCESCEFVFTSFFDDWSPGDFSAFIYNDDYIKVDPEYVAVRPERTAADMAGKFAGAQAARILDYGSGAGVFARRMRELGFASIDNYDPFSSPTRPSSTYDLITAFEVVEHSPNPHATISDMLSYLGEGGCLIIGQTLQPPDICVLGGDWWYLAPRNGHVSTFSSKTLETYASANALRYFEGSHIFGFSRDDLSDLSAAVLGRISKPRHHLSLTAPTDDGARHAGWHGFEQDGDFAFRWTAEPEISFGLHRFEPGVTVVTIPMHMEIAPAFSSASVLRVGDTESGGALLSKNLTFHLEFAEPMVAPMILKTPKPLTPYERDGTPDARPLGLAIPCR